MADVFISYSRDDSAFVQELVAILQSSGVSVWWDRDLVGGSEFHRVIEQQINDAGKVIVVWSARSVDSTWVMDEANAARDLKKIVPLVIDDCMPPMGHRSLHTLRSRSADAIKTQILTAVGVTPQPDQPAEPKVTREAPKPSNTDPQAEASSTENTSPQSDHPDPALFSDIFDDLFGKHMRTGKEKSDNTPAGTRGSDLRYNLEITLAEAYSGKVAEIDVPTKTPCQTCSGTGAAAGSKTENCPTCAGEGKVKASQGFFTIERKCTQCDGRGKIIASPCSTCDGNGHLTHERKLSVNIPAGVEDGTRIRLAGEGEAGVGDGATGDLYIFLSVKPHEMFMRMGPDLSCTVPITMVTAALGGSIEVPTITGSVVRLKIPEGTGAGQQFRIPGKGMPVLKSKERGNFYVQVEVETPKRLTNRQRDILTSFENTKRPSTKPTRTGLQQNGSDVTCAVRISVVTAALGRPIDIQLVDGSTARVNIVEGTQHGQQYRLRGQGHPRSDGSGKGDMFVRIETEPLTQLTDIDRQLLREFEQESGQATNPESHGFFSKVRDFFDSKPG